MMNKPSGFANQNQIFKTRNDSAWEGRLGGRELSQLAARGSRLTAGIAGRLLFADVLRLETSRAPNAAAETGGRVRVARPTLFCHAKAISVD
jgi:hypothetical protein